MGVVLSLSVKNVETKLALCLWEQIVLGLVGRTFNTPSEVLSMLTQVLSKLIQIRQLPARSTIDMLFVVGWLQEFGRDRRMCRTHTAVDDPGTLSPTAVCCWVEGRTWTAAKGCGIALLLFDLLFAAVLTETVQSFLCDHDLVELKSVIYFDTEPMPVCLRRRQRVLRP